ncbi:MAG TPA: HD domain-containing protein [Fimbriimonadaceae bacterium]|nr:HD domain-containing protein [Fimbriimonadaceae bacterium]
MISRIEELSAQRQRLIQDLLARPRGRSWCEEHSNLADEVILELVRDLVPSASEIAVIAVGGYGRRELAPYSDIDVTVVPENDGSPETDSIVRRFFQGLHDAFGTYMRMSVGYAYRLVADAAGLDGKTRTGLLDARLIAGSPAVFNSLQDALDETFAAGEFILEKIEERQAMFAKYHDTPLVVEPHLKEGAGGLRCFHCANWLRAAIGEREARPHRAYDSILKLRNVLHAQAGKQVDLLSRQRQQEICEVLGTDPFALMSEHASNGLHVHQHYLRAVEKLHDARFQLGRGCVSIRGEARILADADAGEAAVGISVATLLGLRVPDLNPGTPASVNGASAAFALSRGEATVRNIDRSGLLEQLLPELTACRTLIPNDSVHAYTVFEHTLRVVREIESLDPDSFLGQLRDSLYDVEALYLAALLHDVGKLLSEPEHPRIGARIANNIGTRWGLSPRVTDTVVWLIEHHLETSHVIRYRDLAEPGTARDFAALVGDQNRLSMLVLLSYADVRAVGPGLWTPAQDAFLRELHDRTSAILSESIPSPAPSAQRARLMRELSGEDASPEEVQAFVSSLPVHYLNSTPFDRVRVHMRMVAKAREGRPTIDVNHRPDLSATDFTICCLDEPGLLNKILGAFYALDLRPQGIRACTTADVPVALDVFTVNFNGRPVPSATAADTTSALLAVISGERNMEALVRERGKDPDRTQRVLSYRYIEGNPGILEIRAPRGRGLPFRLSRLVLRHGWNISSARLGQWADNASAALYLTKQDGSAPSKAEVDAAMLERETV